MAVRRLSCQISANQRECKQTLKNKPKHGTFVHYFSFFVEHSLTYTRVKSSDVITNVISANQHFASTFPIQIFKFQRRSYKLSFLFPPGRQSATESLLAGYIVGVLIILIGHCKRKSSSLFFDGFIVVVEEIHTSNPWPVTWAISVVSKIQPVDYYQCCVLIGWATTRLYVITH